jgi:hypothetical protein
MALQETFLLPFARSSAAAQQRLIESLPEGEDRAAAEAIQRQQADAFAKDAFAAGTALYPDVGPPKPIDDIAGRIAQARTIAAYRGIPVVPFTADEIAALRGQLIDGTPQQRDAVFARVDALTGDMQAAIGPALNPSHDQPQGEAIADPNIVLAADKGKPEKMPPLPGGASRPRNGWQDDEMPPPKQIDLLSGGRAAGGGFRAPGGTPRVVPKVPTSGSSAIRPGGGQFAGAPGSSE